MSSNRLVNAIKAIHRLIDPPPVTWSGDYDRWSAAEAVCGGYSASEIADRAFAATSKAIEGKVSYARDGVCFDVPVYNWQLLAVVHRLRLKLGRDLRVLDFGGAFGDSYIQHARMISDSVSSWTVIEQESIRVKAEGLPPVEKLRFRTLSEINRDEVDLLVLSSVLQYLPDPVVVVDELLGLGATGIFVDRTGFVPAERSSERITKQTIRPPIYDASYPCRFFPREEFIARFRTYDLIAEWTNPDRANLPSRFLGMYLERQG